MTNVNTIPIFVRCISEMSIHKYSGTEANVELEASLKLRLNRLCPVFSRAAESGVETENCGLVSQTGLNLI